MSADSGQAQTGQAIDQRLMAAVQAGDDAAFFEALRSATFVFPVRMVGGRAQSLRLEMDGLQRQAVFTSMELAQQAIAHFTGSTDGWQAPTFTADEFVKDFSEADPPFMLLNPGTQVQRGFRIEEMVKHWRAAGHDVSMPRKRRGSIKAGLTMLLFAALAFAMWSQSSNSTVMCGSQVMAPDDTCMVTVNGDTSEQSFDQTRSSQQRMATIALVVGVVLGVGAVYMLVARIVTAGRRRE